MTHRGVASAALTDTQQRRGRGRAFSLLRSLRFQGGVSVPVPVEERGQRRGRLPQTRRTELMWRSMSAFAKPAFQSPHFPAQRGGATGHDGIFAILGGALMLAGCAEDLRGAQNLMVDNNCSGNGKNPACQTPTPAPTTAPATAPTTAPAPPPATVTQVGLVNVYIGTALVAANVNVDAAAAVVANACGVDLPAINALVYQVSQSGAPTTACTQVTGPVTVTKAA